ncbi:MAG: hypothetical protein QOH35_2652 [Acidobacteriaceae bacterium]|nr:hypothetical protein [Acidobacteriaceae bacterium]
MSCTGSTGFTLMPARCNFARKRIQPDLRALPVPLQISKEISDSHVYAAYGGAVDPSLKLIINSDRIQAYERFMHCTGCSLAAS